ncbi:hypothetical protein HOLleu_39768 [Holothuria leucospilota]|uniref:SCAN box domain-containing protein n=1 Tax=Holothuria leucospilota TaxID=206669 RepID=A0A9Q0YCP6_HOLLE|nr:hypothetical protein HOLleu_39768 [Holothuria leucospilota]
MSDTDGPPQGQQQDSSSGTWEVHSDVQALPEGIPLGLPKEIWVEYLCASKRIEKEAKFNLKKLEIEKDLTNAQGNGTQMVNWPHNARFTMLPRLNATDDIDVYFKTFENLAKIYGWPEAEWAAKLAPELTGKARSAYAPLSAEECNDYPTLKRVVLAKYERSAESYRVAFRSRYKRRDEGLRERISDLGPQFDGWLEYAGVQNTDAKGIRELMVNDQALSKLPPDMAIYLKDRNPRTSEELTRMADQFVANRGGPNYWKRKETDQTARKHTSNGKEGSVFIRRLQVLLTKEGDRNVLNVVSLVTFTGIAPTSRLIQIQKRSSRKRH